MLKNPTGFYESRRSWNLLKVKSSLDDDGIIEKCIYYNNAKNTDKKRLSKFFCYLKMIRGTRGQGWQWNAV
jgi:ATP-dependent DNA ligase